MIYTERPYAAVHAIQFTGDNLAEVLEFIKGADSLALLTGTHLWVGNWTKAIQDTIKPGNYLTRPSRERITEQDKYAFEVQYAQEPPRHACDPFTAIDKELIQKWNQPE